jgi:hypothetical protein
VEVVVLELEIGEPGEVANGWRDRACHAASGANMAIIDLILVGN